MTRTERTAQLTTKINAYIEREDDTSILVAVEDARSTRSAVQAARRAATEHYGLTVGPALPYRHSPEARVLRYVFSAPDLVATRETWEVRTTDRQPGRSHSGSMAFDTEAEAMAYVTERENSGDVRRMYVVGPIIEYRRTHDVCG